MIKNLPENLKQHPANQVYEMLNFYYETIIQEYEAFNHSLYVYPHLKDLQREINDLLQLEQFQENTNLLELKSRSSTDPIIQEIEWDNEEYNNPVTTQSVRVGSIESKTQNRNSRKQINSCIIQQNEETYAQFGSQSMKLSQIEDNEQIQELQIPLFPIKEFDEKSYISQINFERNPSFSIKEVIEQRIQQAHLFYEDALLDNACYVIQQARNEASENNLNGWFNDQFGEFSTDLELKMEAMQKNLKELQNQDGWVVEKASKNLQIKYKILPESNTVTIYMDSIFNANITKLMALINEIELYPQYAPFVIKSKMNKQLGKCCKICDIQVYFPLVADRKAYFVGEGIDRLAINGTIVFMCKSVDNDPEYLRKNDIDISAELKKFVNLTMNYYIYELTPISNTQCRVRCITNNDPKVKFLPQALVSLVARKMATTLFERMQKISQNFERSPWQAKFEANIDFYKWIENKVDTHLKTL